MQLGTMYIFGFHTILTDDFALNGKKFKPYKLIVVPGPASTVEEHSLRNIPSEGKVVRSSPRIPLFRRDFFAPMFDGISNYRTSSSNHATSISERLLRQLLLYEEERSLGNWSYDVILESGTTSYTLLRNSTLIYNQH